MHVVFVFGACSAARDGSRRAHDGWGVQAKLVGWKYRSWARGTDGPNEVKVMLLMMVEVYAICVRMDDSIG